MATKPVDLSEVRLEPTHEDTHMVPGPGAYAAETELILPEARAARAPAQAPRGVIVDAPLAAQQHKDYIVQAAFKNGGMLAAFVWMAVVGSGWVEWSAFALFYVLNVLGESLAHHRYFGHGAFKTSTPMRYALAILAQSGAYGSALYWVADHRRHHSLSDQPGDVHSPYYDGQGRAVSRKEGFKHAHLGWAFDNCSTDLEIYGKGLLDDPVLVFAHKTRWVWFWTSGVIVPALWGWAFGGTWQHAVGTVLIAGSFRMVLGLHAISALNSICHLWGTERFKGPWKAKNNWFVALVSLGEGWHNNHHAHPRAATTSTRWWEIDMTYWVIVALEKLGLVWDVRRMPKGDGSSAKLIA